MNTIEEKSIGETNSIYVSYSNPKNCNLKYYFYLLCICIAIIIPFCLITPSYFNHKYGN